LPWLNPKLKPNLRLNLKLDTMVAIEDMEDTGDMEVMEAIVDITVLARDLLILILKL